MNHVADLAHLANYWGRIVLNTRNNSNTTNEGLKSQYRFPKCPKTQNLLQFEGKCLRVVLQRFSLFDKL